jgi:hypothetical protein
MELEEKAKLQRQGIEAKVFEIKIEEDRLDEDNSEEEDVVPALNADPKKVVVRKRRGKRGGENKRRFKRGSRRPPVEVVVPFYLNKPFEVAEVEALTKD